MMRGLHGRPSATSLSPFPHHVLFWPPFSQLLIPLSLLLDAGGLFKHRKGLGALCRLLLLAAKAAATYYAIDWLKATDQGAEPGPEGPVIYRPFAQADPVEESANASARFDPPQTTQVPSSSAGVQGGSAAAAEEGRATVTAAAAPTNLI